MSDTTTVKRGFEFTHDKWMDPDWKPNIAAGERYVDAPKARCIVTRATARTVYYALVPTEGAPPLRLNGQWWMDRATFEARFVQ